MEEGLSSKAQITFRFKSIKNNCPLQIQSFSNRSCFCFSVTRDWEASWLRLLGTFSYSFEYTHVCYCTYLFIYTEFYLHIHILMFMFVCVRFNKQARHTHLLLSSHQRFLSLHLCISVTLRINYSHCMNVPPCGTFSFINSNMYSAVGLTTHLHPQHWNYNGFFFTLLLIIKSVLWIFPSVFSILDYYNITFFHNYISDISMPPFLYTLFTPSPFYSHSPSFIVIGPAQNKYIKKILGMF